MSHVTNFWFLGGACDTRVCLQVKAYPSADVAASATNLAALLFSPRSRSRSSRAQTPESNIPDSSALPSAQAQIASALAESDAGAPEAVPIALKLASEGNGAAWHVAAHLCLKRQGALDAESSQKLMAYALTHADTPMMSQLLALRKAPLATSPAEHSAGAILNQLGSSVTQSADKLTEQLRLCFANMRGKDVRNGAPSLGHAAPAALVCMQLLRRFGASAFFSLQFEAKAALLQQRMLLKVSHCRHHSYCSPQTTISLISIAPDFACQSGCSIRRRVDFFVQMH